MLYRAAFEWEKVVGAAKMRQYSLFRIAQMTEAIICLGVVQLIDQGVICPDDPIRDHIRDLVSFEVFTEFDDTTGKYEKRSNAKEVTIKHLLIHTAGLAF